ncbi:hypothetical protein F5Y08DRAFT_117304 [Xylaria arbuscula]|nr:hypothetical protein F5Y08DRAFT_117304 [Xylaria arbuscula]
MSGQSSPKFKSDPFSHISDDAGDFEDNYTVVRPPQFKLSTQPFGESSSSGPSAIPQAAITTAQRPGHLMSSHSGDAVQHYPSSDSTATARADAVAAATQASIPRLQSGDVPTIRADILYQVNRDYDTFAQPSLTEGAVAALDHDYTHRSVSEWVHGRSQFSPAEQMERSMSEFPVGARTQTATRTGSTVGSSWSLVSLSTLSQMGYAVDYICGTGVQFADVSAPAGNLLLEEDCT